MAYFFNAYLNDWKKVTQNSPLRAYFRAPRYWLYESGQRDIRELKALLRAMLTTECYAGKVQKTRLLQAR